MSDRGDTKVLSYLHSLRDRDELPPLLSLVEALRARQPLEAEERVPFSVEESAVLGVLRRRLSSHAGEARHRLERALLKVELLRRWLIERTFEPAEEPATNADVARQVLMIQGIQASYLAKSRTAYQAARQAALEASYNTELTPNAQNVGQERVRGLAKQAAAMALAGYLADVKSSQPSRVLNALRDQLTTHVATILRVESALRIVDGLSATADAGKLSELLDENAPARRETPTEDTPPREASGPEAREERTVRPRRKTSVKPQSEARARNTDSRIAKPPAKTAEAPPRLPPTARKRSRRMVAK